MWREWQAARPDTDWARAQEPWATVVSARGEPLMPASFSHGESQEAGRDPRAATPGSRWPQPESAVSSCCHRQALRAFLSEAIPPKFQSSLYVSGCVFFPFPSAHLTFTHCSILTSSLSSVFCPYSLAWLVSSLLYWPPFLPISRPLPANNYLVQGFTCRFPYPLFCCEPSLDSAWISAHSTSV